MPASEPLFCFTSNKIEVHPCPNCRAPMMLVRINSDGLNLEMRTFECFNCDGADKISSHRPVVSV
jgi:hypothetical protein